MARSDSLLNAETSRRLPAVDGLRGLLALVVLSHHLLVRFGGTWLFKPSDLAVCGFFTLSGYVLTRSWDGRFGLFLARRFLRLWPVYALCLAVGYAIAGVSPVVSQFFWFPVLTANAKPEIDPPIWSLCIEAWAMLFMPFFVWAGTGKPWRAIVGAVATYAAGYLYLKLNFGLFFIAGAFLSRWEFRERFLESPIPQWLGRVSYSLYLSHWLVFALAWRLFGDIGLIASLPIAFATGWLVWRYVEMPSIRLSRRVNDIARARKVRSPAIAAAE